MDSKVFDLTDGGERVTHLYPNSCYFAHLSIYAFAAPFCTGGRVLDAGAGAGYGSCYLADHGAAFVEAIDVSAKAIAFSKSHFQRNNLRFALMGLEQIDAYPDAAFDAIFSSNTLEHITSVPAFLYAAARILKPDGRLIVAVPPIFDDYTRRANLANPYHLNIWSPQQWQHVFCQFFVETTCYLHHFDKPGYELDFSDTPESTAVGPDDFVFHPATVEEMMRAGTITAIFVMQRPRPASELPTLAAASTMIDDSVSRTAPPTTPMAAPVKPSWRERIQTTLRKLTKS